MSTLNRYLSNATKKGISAQQSYDNLISEFRKGNVSYPRTDGKNHAPLKVLDENNINRYVKTNIESEPVIEIQDLGDSILVKADPFILNEYLKLSTPATLVNDYQKCNRLNTYKKDEDLLIGLKHYQYEQSLINNQVELTEFNLQDLILDTVSNELAIEKEDLEINFHEIDF